MSAALLAVLAVAGAAVLAGGGWAAGHRHARRGERAAGLDLGTPVERATFHTLHTASLAAPPLRAGLTEDAARKAAKRLRSLLGTEALCLTDRASVLAWDGPGADHHERRAMARVKELLESGRSQSVRTECQRPECPLKWAVVAPSRARTGCWGRWWPTVPGSRPCWCGRRRRSRGGSPYSWSCPSWTGRGPG